MAAISSLLCPVAISWPMVVATSTFVVGTLLLPFAGAYALFWLRRYGLPLSGLTRLTGRVVGPGPRGSMVCTRGLVRLARRGAPLVLRCDAGRELLVCTSVADLRGWRRGIRVGDALTLDGLFDSVQQPGERLFREPGAQPGLRAVRLARGRWPRLQWLMRGLVWIWLLSFGVLLARCSFG